MSEYTVKEIIWNERVSHTAIKSNISFLTHQIDRYYKFYNVKNGNTGLLAKNETVPTSPYYRFISYNSLLGLYTLLSLVISHTRYSQHLTLHNCWTR